jgi:hypothetical protein
MARNYAKSLKPERIAYLSAKFGLPEWVFAELQDLGSSGGNSHGWIAAFPERAADGTITGLKERTPGPNGDVQKYFVRSQPGLTILTGFADSSGPVLVTEGASCTLAAAAAGLQTCVSRRLPGVSATCRNP